MMLPATPAHPERVPSAVPSAAADGTGLDNRLGGAPCPAPACPSATAVRDAVGQTAEQASREWVLRERVVRAVGGRVTGPAADMRADGMRAAPAVAPGLVALLDDVRATVTTYVGRRRGEGTPVQRVLPEVKALVRGAVSGVEMREVAELLLTHAVRWSIEAYYAPDGGSQAAVPSAAPNAQPGGGRVPPSC